VLIVLAHVLVAQLTLVVAVLFYLLGKATRWRPTWLLAPAAVGLAWLLAVGPHAAATGFAAGPAQVLGYLGARGREASHALHPGAAFAGGGSWLPRQLPLALLAGVAEAGLASWLSWLHTDEWDVPRRRPGLLVAFRRLSLTRMIRAGGVVTRDGACLGIAPGSGARVALRWREAAGGVLVCGSAGPDLLAASFQLVHAALRRRKPVLVVDLTADPGLPRQFAAACAEAVVPLQVFGGAGGPVAGNQPACYEPFRYGSPAHRARLVTAMLTWDGPGSQYRRGCAAYLEDVFELLDAAPGDPRVPVLDEVLHLLSPAALRARAQHVPAGYPRRDVLAERTQVSASVTDAEPAAIAMLTRELRTLRATPVGRWLRQPIGGQVPPIDLGRTISGRAAALFCLGHPDGTVAAHETNGVNGTAMLTRLICQDLLGLGTGLRAAEVDADAIVWLAGCDAIAAGTLADLIAAGPATGLAVVATTSSVQVAGDLAEHPNVLLVHHVADPAIARRLAAVAAPRLAAPGSVPPGSAATEAPLTVTADDLMALADGEFVLAVARPRRLVRRALAVRARIRGGQHWGGQHGAGQHWAGQHGAGT
jgi:hypothetical protein